MRYTTKSGVRLEIGRIPRKSIDDFGTANMPPEPPIEKVEVFGGITEDIENLKDHNYLMQMQLYYFEVGNKSIDLIAPAIEIIDPADEQEINDLRETGIPVDTDADILRMIILDDDSDLANVVGGVWHQSTVTPRGLLEAERRFNVRWQGKRLSPFSVGFPDLRASEIFNHRRAANRQGYTWHEFCAFAGPEQCEIVVMDSLENKVRRIMSQ